MPILESELPEPQTLEQAKSHYAHRNYELAKTLLVDLTSQVDDPNASYYLAAISYQRGRMGHAIEPLLVIQENEETPRYLRSRATDLLKRSVRELRPFARLNFRLHSDSNEDRKVSQSLYARMSFTDYARLWVEPGTLEYSAKNQEDLKVNELRSGILVFPHPLARIDGTIRYRSIEDESNTFGYDTHLKVELGSGGVRIGWSKQDVDTLEAIRTEISREGLTFDVDYDIGRRWKTYGHFKALDHSDGLNSKRVNVGARYSIFDDASLSVGPNFIFRDTSGYSSLYYTPQSLNYYSVAARNRAELSDFVILKTAASFGIAEDSLNANRIGGDFRLSLETKWDSAIRPALSMTYSKIADYESIDVLASLLGNF